MTPEVLAWTDKQRSVIELPVDSKALVIADAGTGKTAVLVQRLARLVGEEGLAPGSDVLVLSFTRAVVAEIRERLRGHCGWVPLIAPRTFDSFATRLLSEVDPGGAWIDAGYDGRIRAAANLLSTSEEAKASVGRYRHIFVDEIQDLVGVRAEFVERLLEASESGFTLFGDPAQAIYDYQVEGPSESMFESIRSRFTTGLTELTLSENHRAQSDITRLVIALGKPLSEPNPKYRRIGQDLLSVAEGVHDIGSPESAAAVLRLARGATAILTRDNGHALLLSEKLWESDVRHRLQRSASDRAVAPWVARVFRSARHATVSRRALEDLIANEAGDAVEPDEGWRLLKRLDGSRENRVDLNAVRTAIARGATPRELSSHIGAAIVVSTIHRAKGLEFDSVILLRTVGASLEDFLDFEDEDQLAGEVRVLYVALSRPRRHLMQLSDHDSTRISLDARTHRWFRRGWESWQTFGFEVDVDDIDRTQPPGAKLDDADALELQDYLVSEVRTGDPIELRFLQETVAGPVGVTYSVHHRESAIGITSKRFGQLLHLRLHGGRRRGSWPKRIFGLRVEGVETTAGLPAAGINNGLGISGLWLRPRVVGLGEFEW